MHASSWSKDTGLTRRPSRLPSSRIGLPLMPCSGRWVWTRPCFPEAGWPRLSTHAKPRPWPIPCWLGFLGQTNKWTGKKRRAQGAPLRVKSQIFQGRGGRTGAGAAVSSRKSSSIFRALSPRMDWGFFSNSEASISGAITAMPELWSGMRSRRK